MNEPGVLERLRSLIDEYSIANPYAREVLADAIAEIEELLERSKRQSARFKSVCEIHELAEADLLKAYEEAETSDMVLIGLQRKLFVYTDAEVVWQARRIVHGHAFPWFGIYKSEVGDYKEKSNREVRALIALPETPATASDSTTPVGETE